MSTVAEFVTWLTYPPNLSLLLALAGVAMLLVLRWRRTAAALVAMGIAWSALWSVPLASDWLCATLERRHPVVPATQLPEADAIVVLGGADSSWWRNRPDVTADELESSRLAAGARAWLAGRAPVVILSGGGGPRRTEAGGMAAAIERLGVPASALLLEERSHDTRGNARFTTELARRHGMQRLLLVTSALHMPRALVAFERAGADVVPVPALRETTRRGWRNRWLPRRSMLERSGKALKEYAGLLGLRVEGWAAELPGRAPLLASREAPRR